MLVRTRLSHTASGSLFDIHIGFPVPGAVSHGLQMLSAMLFRTFAGTALPARNAIRRNSSVSAPSRTAKADRSAPVKPNCVRGDSSILCTSRSEASLPMYCHSEIVWFGLRNSTGSGLASASMKKTVSVWSVYRLACCSKSCRSRTNSARSVDVSKVVTCTILREAAAERGVR